MAVVSWWGMAMFPQLPARNLMEKVGKEVYVVLLCTVPSAAGKYSPCPCPLQLDAFAPHSTPDIPGILKAAVWSLMSEQSLVCLNSLFEKPIFA